LLTATIAAGAAALAGPTLAAVTDNMYLTANFQPTCFDGGHFCQTDNAALSVYREGSVSSTGKANIRDTLDSSFDTTSLTVSYPSTPVYSGSAETDIIYQTNASRLPSGAVGFTWCDNAASYFQCDQHYIAFRPSTPGADLACHETGHAVGLTHGGHASPALSDGDTRLACMTTPVLSRWLGASNAEAINGTY
jgi:hypothetical protein